MEGNVAIAQFLAPMMEEHLFDVDNEGYTALHCAAYKGQLSMVKYLVKSCRFDLKAKNKVGFLCFLVILSILYFSGPSVAACVIMGQLVTVVFYTSACFENVIFMSKNQPCDTAVANV